jgi:alkylation response protein AidB-like acyl-CoA dehydrogenase
VRKALADEHGQHVMGSARDRTGAGGMLSGPAPPGGPEGGLSDGSARLWEFGFLFSPALTIGGGTAEVQRNIIAERTLGLPHDPST